MMLQLQKAFAQGKMDDDKVLEMWADGMGHTKGADYVVGAGEDIISDLVGHSINPERVPKERVLKVIKRNIRQAVRDNKVFEGMRGEDRETFEIWKKWLEDNR